MDLWIVGIAVLAGAGMVVVVVDEVGVAVLAGMGSEVVVEMWHTSTTRSAGCDGCIVSMSCSSSKVHNFTIAFHVCSRNEPDQVSTQVSVGNSKRSGSSSTIANTIGNWACGHMFIVSTCFSCGIFPNIIHVC